MRQHLISNHLSSGYSDFVLSSLKKISSDLSIINSKIIDVGCGQCRHIKLLKFLGFKKANLFAIDKIKPRTNPKNLCHFYQYDIEEGIYFLNQNFDLVLANFVLMYIAPENLNFVIFDLMRITRKYLIIETNKSKDVTYMYPYDFQNIVASIKAYEEFEIIQVRNSSEKLLLKRRI